MTIAVKTLEAERNSKPSAISRAARSERFYRPELDALRFFAFFAVFLTHGPRPSIAATSGFFQIALLRGISRIQDSGVFGLFIFFILSSYLITELLEREKESTGTIGIQAFYLRRVFRIWPLYFVFLGAVAAVSFTPFARNFGIEKWRLVTFLLLLGNWYTASFGYGNQTVGALWTISLEEQFYLIWPSIAKAGNRAMWLAALLTFPIALIVLCVSSAHGVSMQPTLWVNSFVEFPLFAIGGMLALLLRKYRPHFAGWMRFLFFVSGIGLWLLAVGRYNIQLFHPIPAATLVLGYLLAICGAAIVFLSIIGIPAHLVPKPLIYLGKISYGLYVFHDPCLKLAQVLLRRHGSAWGATLGLAFCLSVFLASLSYRFIEAPFLRLKKRFTVVESRAV